MEQNRERAEGRIPAQTNAKGFEASPGEQRSAKACGERTEVYSRVVGYFRPIAQWNQGKQQEFKDRREFELPCDIRTGEAQRYDSVEKIPADTQKPQSHSKTSDDLDEEIERWREQMDGLRT